MSTKEHHHTHEGVFDHNLPRPPVPGEEKNHFPSERAAASASQMASYPEKMERFEMDVFKFTKPMSPLPKRNFNLVSDPVLPHHSDTSSSSRLHPATRLPEMSCGSHSNPSCLRWAESLHTLLQDGDGVKLFRQYLESEGKQHADALDFWFACEGLRKQQTPDKIYQLVKVIYKKFFVKSALPISEELRKEIGRSVKSSQPLEPPVTLFDEAQDQVERLIVTTTYPNFLKSEVYLQYIENAQTSSSGSSSEFNELSNLATGGDPLPTLHEDMELVMNPPVHMSHPSGSLSTTGYHTPNLGAGPPVRLTKDVLLLSQSRRAVDRTKSETFASLFMHPTRANTHAAYNSYNPVSRQDSELHSISSRSLSDARTDSDCMSMTDSSVDGRSLVRTSRRQAVLNKEKTMNQFVIPRTQRVDKKQCQPMETGEFATILIEKLEVVKKEQDAQELLEKKLKESESMTSVNDRDFKLLLDDENDQSILDDHVSLVFPDTPVRSPGISSPRRNRHLPNSRRKKDGSIFSSDSGNVHDFAEGSEHRLGMVKSKSMPEYPEERFIRGAVGRRSSSKKALTELTDSGVSVISDNPPPVPPPHKDSRVMAWLMESDRSGRGSGHTHSEMSLRHKSHKTSSATSPIANRHRKGFGSRSSSVERNSTNSATIGPAQPFVADPSMPPLPLPNTSFQLEEARRRLMEDDVRNKLRQRASSSRHYPDLPQASSSRHYPELTQSSQSTLRKSQRGQRPVVQQAPPPTNPASEELVMVVFTFCEEQFPYRTKIPGTNITLRQFKEYLPKKGNYRFYFKTVCEELGNQVIQEEVSNDNDVIPLLDGKIMGQVVRPID